jgi:hypothetical protein
MIRRKSHVDTLKLDIARRPGFMGALMQRSRLFLWKLLRYQHNRIVTRQNLVNTQLTATLEFQLEEIRRLRSRVDELEKRGGAK